MTEQEKREKTIEDMRRIEGDVRFGCIHDCYECRKDRATCIYGAFYDAGYRKPDEVREEITADVLQKLFTAIRNCHHLIEYSEFTTDPEMWAIDLDDLQDLIKKEFDVEVKE